MNRITDAGILQLASGILSQDCIHNIKYEYRKYIVQFIKCVILTCTHTLQSCLMCVAFHPSQPALIAGGTFSGEVWLWNIGIETDPLLASSGLSDLGHKEPISKVRISLLQIIYHIAEKFGGLAVYIITAKNLPKFPTCIYTYDDPVPNRQI